MILVVAALVAIIVFAAARVVAMRGRTSRIVQRVEAHVVVAPPPRPRRARQSRFGGLLDDVERSLEHHSGWNAFECRVERAGVERRAVELAAAVATATVLLVVLALVAGSPAGAAVVAVVPAALTSLGLGVLARRRLRAFDEQLPSILSTLAASLRAGHGFLHSLQAVADDAPEPAGRELRRALAEIRLGRPVEEALGAIGRRIPSRDLVYVLTAIAVQRQIGGSLADLFETVTETVRQRQHFARKVRALTSTGRTSAHMLISLPFGLAALLTLINHHYLTPLFTTHLGRLLLLAGLVSLLIGTLLVRRIVSFKV